MGHAAGLNAADGQGRRAEAAVALGRGTEEDRMERTIPSLSRWDDLLFNLGYVVPMALQGTFTRSRFWTRVWNRAHPDAAAVRFARHLRRRYPGGPGLYWLHLGTTRALLVLDQAAI